MPVKDSDMQNAEMDFLKDMKGYAKKEEEKDENDVFGVLITTELKKLSKKKQSMAKRKIQNLIYDMQMEDEEPLKKRNNFDNNWPKVNYSNPIPTFPRFLDLTMLVNRRASILNEVSLSSPPVFQSTPNLATSLDQYRGIGKQWKFVLQR